MRLGLLLLVYGARWCIGERLAPLDNNDQLEDINSEFVAEFQWESWPIKQEPLEQDIRSPGARLNVALWKDTSGPSWYLFGGRSVHVEPRKIYSDVWRYSIVTRTWERFFPLQSEIKGANVAKIGGMMTLRASLFDEGLTQNPKSKNYNIVLCGRVTKTNSTKTKKLNIWNNFTRRKKLEEEKNEELKSLAVYAPRTSKSNTVWQIDLKDKLWTAYVCCCDTSNNAKENSTSKAPKVVESSDKTQNESLIKHSIKVGRTVSSEKNETTSFDFKIDKAEDEVDAEQQHLSISNLKNNKRKINKSRKLSDNVYKKSKEIEKRSSDGKEGNVNKTQVTTQEVGSQVTANVSLESTLGKNDTKISKKEKYNLKMKDVVKINKTEVGEQLNDKNVTDKSEKITKPKVASKYCPEFAEGGEPMTWCDGDNEVLITTDISSPQVTLWIFNLRTSHWSQEEVSLGEDVKWPFCANRSSIRYAGIEEELYIICSVPDKQMEDERLFLQNPANPSRIPSEDNFTIKIVYRINYKSRVMENLGDMQLGSFFGTPEGVALWENYTKTNLQVFRTPDNDTLLMVAYLDSLDLWFLCKDQLGVYYFELVQKIWRGSALKWFIRFNGAMYNLQFTSDSGKSETILMPNPRGVAFNEYWPRERGRFIVRIIKNEHVRNRNFENRTREKNLTYELLQSDSKPPVTESQFNHTYSLKVLVFFGISLAIFTAFGFAIFLKRCVTCPTRIRARSECHKSPLVIRYSVIPDDLLYPVA